MKQHSCLPVAPNVQLDIFATLEAVEFAAASPAKPAVPAGAYVIRSKRERGYWSIQLGWVHDLVGATPFLPSLACGVTLAQWRSDGKPITSSKGDWLWIARSGGLSGHRGADFDGPFRTEAEALDAAIATIGLASPGLNQQDAEYVLASACTDFPLDD